MSFSSEVKSELCRLPVDKYCCAMAEAYGAMLFGRAFTETSIRMVTEHAAVAARLAALFKKAFGLSFDLSPAKSETAGKRNLALVSREKISLVRALLGYGQAPELALHLNNAMLEEDCCKTSFLRGAFLTGGSVIDPEKKYHLELVTPHQALSRETVALLLEVGLPPKLTLRAGGMVIYFKQSEAIEDFLTATGAPLSAVRLMETKIEKDVRNQINRKVNCETGNLTKTVEAVLSQREAIARLQGSPVWETLPEPLRETARLRLDYPEDSLVDLCQRFDPPLGRSGLNHRLRKLVELAKHEPGAQAK